MTIDTKNINPPTASHLGTAKTALGDDAAKQAKSTTTSPAQQDVVSITTQAQQLQGIQAQLANAPEVDLQKVEEIKLAISEGRYKVDVDKLATNIANFENDLSELE